MPDFLNYSLLKNKWFQVAVTLLIGFICYANTLNNSFAWDDREFLINWPQIKASESGLPAYLSLPFLLSGEVPQDHKGVFRPIRSVLYLVSYSLYGENPFWYHLQSLIVHSLITLIIYLITEVITERKTLAFITATLFASHPTHTEAVSFITASFDTIGILLFFLSFYLYVKSQTEKFKQNTYILGSILYGSVAFLIYEMTLVLPLLIVLYDFCTNNFSFKKLWQKRNIYQYYFLAVVIYGLSRIIIFGVGDRGSLGESFLVTANQARVSMIEIYLKYVYLMIWPVNLGISHMMPTFVLNQFLWGLFYLDPTQNLIDLSSRIVFLFPLIYVSIILIAGYLLLKKIPLAFFTLAWFFITLLPASNILPQGATMGIRFLYIPSFGFILLSVLIASQILSLLNNKIKSKTLISVPATLLFVSIIVFFSYVTINRNFDWKDEKTFWSAAARDSSWDVRPYRALAQIYFSEGDFKQAEENYFKALERDPKNPQSNSEIGVYYMKRENYDLAIHYLNKAIEYEPKYYQAYYYLGNIYFIKSDFPTAEEKFKQVLQINPNDILALPALANVYFEQKKYQEALEVYNQLAKFNPSSPLYKYKLGLTYIQLARFSEAEKALISSLHLNPKQPDVYKALAALSLKIGNTPKAKQVLEEGIKQTGNQILKEDLTSLQAQE